MRKYDEQSNVIGDVLLEYRTKNNLSQTDLCNKLELYGIEFTRDDISKIERKIKIVKDFEVWGFAKVLGISTDQFYTDIEKEFNN